VLFQDEARFGRISDPRACWVPPGVRAAVHAHHIREYLYLYAAVDPFTGTMTSLIRPDVNTHAMSSFLDQVAKEYPHEHILMVMDGAGWHRAAELKIPHRITIVHLPPYSPELNPAEHLWDELREKHFANRVFDDLEAVFQHLIKAVRLLHHDPQRIASLTGFDWIIRGR
jgi:transposase